MAKYDFKCNDCGEIFELETNIGKLMQLELKCPHCNSENICRLWNTPNVIYKGSGFYSTDNRKRS